MINVTLDKDAVQGVIDALPKTIFQAQRSAIGTTTTFAKKQLQNKMAAKTGINPKVFKQIRIKVKRDRERGIVWFGYNEVKAGYVGKLVQEHRGAWAGQYYFPGGFIIKMKDGYQGIFKRAGKSRFPIVEQTVNLNVGVEVAESVAKEAEIELKNRFIDKLRQLNPDLR